VFLAQLKELHSVALTLQARFIFAEVIELFIDN